MKFHIGYTNPTKESDKDNPRLREKVYITLEELRDSHLHGVGSTRSGKTKWLEGFCRELAKNDLGFTVIDPQGQLSEDLISYFAYLLPKRPIIYFDPSRTDYIIPYNPFGPGTGDPSVRVDKHVEAILRVWGAENPDTTPTLNRWLRCLFFAFSTGKMTLNEVGELFTFSKQTMREYAVEILHDQPHIQGEWLDLIETKPIREFKHEIGSIKNRLVPFIYREQMLRMMSSREKNLDFSEIFNKGAIVIANLKSTDYFTEENAKVIGALMINDLWDAARRHGSKDHNPYFLLVDEAPMFLTPDIRQILDRGAGKGLHLGVFHQHLSQFKEQDPLTFASLINAKIKMVFGE